VIHELVASSDARKSSRAISTRALLQCARCECRARTDARSERLQRPQLDGPDFDRFRLWDAIRG
jgi:hypothetical protein